MSLQDNIQGPREIGWLGSEPAEHSSNVRTSGFRNDLHNLLFEEANVALLLLKADARLCCSNRRGRKMLASGEVIEGRAGRVLCKSRKNRAVLQEALAQASHRPRVYALQSGEQVIGMCVRALPDRAGLILLSLRPSQSPPIHRLAPLILTYGLTVRELYMARLLINGRDVAAASKIMGVTTLTGRTFVKHLYAKLGIRTRSQLVSLVLRYSSLL
jgi:DNA-binding CsgD family transcriptional regulator